MFVQIWSPSRQAFEATKRIFRYGLNANVDREAFKARVLKQGPAVLRFAVAVGLAEVGGHPHRPALPPPTQTPSNPRNSGLRLPSRSKTAQTAVEKNGLFRKSLQISHTPVLTAGTWSLRKMTAVPGSALAPMFDHLASGRCRLRRDMPLPPARLETPSG